MVIAAAQAAGVVPGTFHVDSLQPGIFFLEPANVCDANGATMSARPVLYPPVPVSFQQTIAMQVLNTILQRVQQKAGCRFMRGFGTLWSKVSITASNEPVKYVIARLLGAVYRGVNLPKLGEETSLATPRRRTFIGRTRFFACRKHSSWL